MYQKFEQLLKARGITAYKVAKDLGMNSTNPERASRRLTN